MSRQPKRLITAQLPPEGELGEAMLQLNERQRLFVLALMEQTRPDHAAAARTAGYVGTSDYGKTQGYRLAHDVKVIAAIQEEGRRRLQTYTPMAIRTLFDLMNDPATPAREKIKCATTILDRNGLSAISEHTLTVKHEESREEQIKRVYELCKMLGYDPRDALGTLVDVTDADYEIVDMLDNGKELIPLS